MALIERLTELMFYLKKNQKEFADEINFSKQSLNNALIGNTKIPKVDLVQAILYRYKEVNARWLLIGEGEMFSGKETEKVDTNNSTLEDYIKKRLDKQDNKIEILTQQLDEILSRFK